MPTHPPCGVNLIAFLQQVPEDLLEPGHVGLDPVGRAGPRSTPKCSLRASMSGLQTSTARWMTVHNSTGLAAQFDLSRAIRDTSKSRRSAEPPFPRCGGPFPASHARPGRGPAGRWSIDKPMTTGVSGVRSSWLRTARKWSLARLACSATALACSALSLASAVTCSACLRSVMSRRMTVKTFWPRTSPWEIDASIGNSSPSARRR